MGKTIVTFKLNANLFLRDPQETDLGQRILKESIELIDKIGFEQFTFKKLALSIESTEASIYRYFENKNRLLTYLVSWYWLWVDYKIQFYTNNISSPKEKLQIILKIICETYPQTIENHFNEKSLHHIVVAESAKVYLLKEVDEINKEGLYLNYKGLIKKIACLVLELNPKFPYPNALVSTLIEVAHQQYFFAIHLPSLTNIPNNEHTNIKIQEYLELLLWSSIKK